MNIKQFAAKDMRSALRDIRAALGPDAVMLSSRHTEDGVEVTAAIDYDESTAESYGYGAPRAGDTADDVADDEVRLTGIAPEPETRPLSAYEQIAARLDVEPEARPAPSAANEPLLGEELKELRLLLETQLASLAWNDLNRRRPTRARVLRQFAQLGIDADLAREVAESVPPSENMENALRWPLLALAQRVSIAQREPIEHGRILAVVGPTGVGKTTSIAKIAARFVLNGSPHELGLISTDTYRIGARDQLLTFARILGVPMHVAADRDELKSVLDALSHKRLVLIDTAGMGQRDLRLASQFATLKVEGHDVRTLLALSAATDRGTLAEIVDAFRGAAPEALVVTKIDEACTLGPVLSAAIRSGLPIAYSSDGQRVPEDLNVVGVKQRDKLLQRALELAAERSGAGRDEDDLAAQFGAMELAVNG